MLQIEMTPNKGSYSPGEPVLVDVTIGPAVPEGATFVCRFTQLDRQIGELGGTASWNETVRWDPPPDARCVGIEVEVHDVDGIRIGTAATAVDIGIPWWKRPRYGFLCEFSPDRRDVDEVLAELRRFHINGIQFYDWMYRHDDPVPPTDVFDDPLARRLSASTIRSLISACLDSGMAPMAYLAVYGSSMETWREHSDWALYDEDGNGHIFEGDFLGLMDPSRGGGWAKHLLRRCSETLEHFDFAGIHIDQYGEPRTAFTASGDEIDLPVAFVDFVADLKAIEPDRPTTFNAVKNWPIEHLVDAPMDFVYIELWPDMPSQREVADVVSLNLRLGRYRAVVVALYIPEAWEENVLLADALIIASGGSRIEVGEKGRLLTDPYFPLHKQMSPRLRRTLMRFADFRVRFGDLLDRTGDVAAATVGVPDDVWTATNDADGWRIVHLVNMRGIADARWDVEHGPPDPQASFSFDVAVDREVSDVYYAEPESDVGGLQQCTWTTGQGSVHIEVDGLNRWKMIAIKYSSR